MVDIFSADSFDWFGRSSITGYDMLQLACAKAALFEEASRAFTGGCDISTRTWNNSYLPILISKIANAGQNTSTLCMVSITWKRFRIFH